MCTTRAAYTSCQSNITIKARLWNKLFDRLPVPPAGSHHHAEPQPQSTSDAASDAFNFELWS